MLNGKNVLVTGAKGGIGRVLIEEFAKNGANIFAHLRGVDENFSTYIDKISKQYSVKVTPIYFDITDTNLMKQTLKEVFFTQKQHIDILINNAGVAHGGLFVMTPVSKIREVFEINLFSQMELTQFILKLMIRQKSGNIINMGSVLGLDIKEGSSAYGLSKASVIAWTKTLAAEVSQYGIRVNAIAPGLVDTSMGHLMDENFMNELINSCAMKRLATPSEVAKTAIFLSSENSSFINGQVIRVDGFLK